MSDSFRILNEIIFIVTKNVHVLLKFILLVEGGEKMTVNDYYNGRYYFLRLNGLTVDEMLILWKFTRKIDQTYGSSYWALSDNEVRFSEKLFYVSLDFKIEFLRIIGIIEARIDRQNIKQAVEENMLLKKHFDDMEF